MNSEEAARAPVRQSLKALLAAVVSNPSAGYGYTIDAEFFGETCEFTFAKDGKTFVLWLRPATAEGRAYRQTARFKLGYRFEPPDRLGFALLNAMCAEIERWEGALPDGAHTELFVRTPQSHTEPAGQAGAGLDSATQDLLSATTFSLIYRDWLDVREQQLAARFKSLAIRDARNVLLVNATRGLPFYPSMVDFFTHLQRVHGHLRATSASYFREIFQFHGEVADKGLPVVSIAEVMTWSVAEINRFHAVIFIGPSDVMVRFMAMPGVTAKLVLIDLGFYHQLIETYPAFRKGEEVIHNRAYQINRVVAYSCQPEAKITHDLKDVCILRLLEWRWFNYIPIGFSYCTYYRSDRQPFDVALLGSAGRDYAHIDPDRFRGRRFLFVGGADNPGIERLRGQLDIAVVSRVSEDTYARLLAMCRCVVLPLHVHYPVNNVFLSVVDTVASGKALVTPRHAGLARLEREDLPAVFYDSSPAELFRQVDDLLRRAGRLQDIEERSLVFAKEKLDIYQMMQTILDEQVL